VKPRITTALPVLLVLGGSAEERTMAEPLDAVEEKRHHKGDEGQEAETDRPAEDGEQAVGEEGEEEGYEPEAGEDFDWVPREKCCCAAL
jgi:hypothetical protein